MITLQHLPESHPGWSLMTGRTMFFASQLDQRFSYCLYVPSSYTWAGNLPVIVVMHGTGRAAERYRDDLVNFAEEYRAIVVAPLFPAGIDDPDDIHNYKFVEFRGIRFDLILLSMLDEVHLRWNADVDKVFLTGHSGGGQFAHRFLYLHPERLRGVAISAPGRVTLLDDSRTWWAGVADLQVRFGVSLDVRAIAQVPTLLAIGALDTDTSQLAPEVAGQDQPDGSRMDRLLALKCNLEHHGLSPELAVVPDVAHNGHAILPAITEFARKFF